MVIVGDDPASKTYVASKKKACSQAGFYSEEYALPETAAQSELTDLIARLNADPKIHGILVQLPLPKHIDEQDVIDSIDPRKDVDGFHPVNVGNLIIGKQGFVPCTPYGCLKLIESTGVSIDGVRAVVVGRSNIVGKPMGALLMSRGATVTTCHSRTRDLAEECRRADILVAAVGRPKMITGDMVKPGAVVIDVGINRVDGKIVGDVDFDSVSEVAGYITPVPGGVGPMTITMLLQNTLISASRTC